MCKSVRARLKRVMNRRGGYSLAMPQRMGPGGRVVWLCFGALVGVVVVFPFCTAVFHLVRGVVTAAPKAGADEVVSWNTLCSPWIIAGTLAWSLGIAVCSAALAWPAAWALVRHGRRAAPWMLVPLTMPTYLAYAGYGLARAPGTTLGDWLELAAHEGWPLAPVIAGKTLAFLGMCLWCWPIPALVIGWAAMKLDPAILESLRIDRPGVMVRHRTLARMVARPLVASIGLVAMLMLGSAIPLHLAQADTWSIKLWFALDNMPWDSRWKVWLLASPVAAAGAVAAWFIARWAQRGAEGSEAAGPPARAGWLAVLPGIGVWMAATVAPLLLFAFSLRLWSSLIEFWRVNTEAVVSSLTIAALVGAACAGLCAGAWMLASSSRRVIALRLALAALTAAGLAPGVVVGAVVNEAWSTWPATSGLADSLWIVVLTHTARFGWIAALLGCCLAGMEPRDRRAQRQIDGAMNLAGWWQASGRPGASLVLSAGIMTGLLSVHEIESTVMVQPPGIDSLSRRILQFLHFSRMEDLSAAGIWLIGGGFLAAGIAAGLAALSGMAWGPGAEGGEAR